MSALWSLRMSPDRRRSPKCSAETYLFNAKEGKAVVQGRKSGFGPLFFCIQVSSREIRAAEGRSGGASVFGGISPCFPRFRFFSGNRFFFLMPTISSV